jgi:hypothetical protein
MSRINQDPPTTWLKTDRRAVAINASMRDHLPAIQAALHHGVAAVADSNRLGFYELGISGNWYYIHIRDGSSAQVYVIAARRESRENSSVLPAAAAFASLAG